MNNIKRDLSYLILGQQGGQNRINILELLKDRSYNQNQLANILDLNYRTIKHHVEVLMDYDLIESSGEGYGQVYFLSPKLENNYQFLEDIKVKLKTVFNSTELYKKIVEQTREGIMILDKNKEIIFGNESAEMIIGYKDQEMHGKNIEKFLQPDINKMLNQVSKKQDFFEGKVEIETNSGDSKTILLSIDFFSFDGEENKGFLLQLKDITIEQTQKEILNALMEHSEVMMAYLDTNFDLVYVNSAYAKNTDLKSEEIIGMNHFELFPNKEYEKIFEDVLEQGELKSINGRSPFDQERYEDYMYWTIDPVKNRKDDVEGIIISFCEHP